MKNSKKRYNVVIIGGTIYNESENTIDKVIKLIMNDVEINSPLYKFNYFCLDYTDRIEYCCGCKNCFLTGKCELDKMDKMEMIKKKLLLSDLVIIATPVYEKNVSGFIKSFFDRIGYWQHLMPLYGKSCIIIISAKYLGYEFVCNYLYETCSSLGLTVIGMLCKNSEQTEEELNYEISFCVSSILFIINNVLNIESNGLLEKIFKNYQYIYTHLYTINEEESLEQKYWKKLSRVSRFQELILETKDKKTEECLNFQLL